MYNQFIKQHSLNSFSITGYKTVISTSNEKEIIDRACSVWQNEKIADTISDKINSDLYFVYYDYNDQADPSINNFSMVKSYSMMIGFMTKDGTSQNNTNLETINIPEQNYKEFPIKGEWPAALVNQWQEIRQTSNEDLPRNFLFDMDVYRKKALL